MAKQHRCMWLVTLLFLSTSSPMLLGVAANGHEATVEQRQVVIAEVLVSASSEQYNGTDWNGDGTIGSVSDQYIELWNTGETAVDVSDWWLDDDPDGGSPPCRLAWNTTLDPNERLVVFRDSSGIELDYWDGDAVTLSTDTGARVDQLVYPGEDSWWDLSLIHI